MKYLLLFLILFPSFTLALTPQQNAVIIAKKAVEYGIDPKLALYITWRESRWNCNAVGDHGTSYGCWQIHNPTKKKVHPLSIAQAKDVLYSTEWSMRTMMSDGNCHQWSTCPSHE